MSVNLVSEEDLRSLLRPFQTDAAQFEADVMARLQVVSQRQVDDPLAGVSRLFRSAAAYLPLVVLPGCKATNVLPLGFAGQCLGILAFPAISLFFLIGATVLSLLKISQVRTSTEESGNAPLPEQEAIRQWWYDNKRGAVAVFLVSLGLAFVGATWILFLAYIVSFGILLIALTSLAKRGLGNRHVVGVSCGMGLMFLGQLASFPEIGSREIHFLDQSLISAVLMTGAFLLIMIGHLNCARNDFAKALRWPLGLLTAAIVVPLVTWMSSSIIWPVSHNQIRKYVEGFERAQNPFILGTGIRTGLMSSDQSHRLKNYQRSLRSLVDVSDGLPPLQITSIEQLDWVIRTAIAQKDLTLREQNLLAQRLQVTLEKQLSEDSYVTLKTLLCVTRLLDLVDHPSSCDPFKERVHQLLKRFHTTHGGGFQFAGGFKTYLNWEGGAWLQQPGSLESTASAIGLMERYGAPEGLDWNWVRAFLRPSSYRRPDDKWIAASLLERLDHVPGITRPTWMEWLYFERTLLAAVLLVGLSLFATLIQPNRQRSALKQA